jgi:hypothetical protein
VRYRVSDSFWMREFPVFILAPAAARQACPAPCNLHESLHAACVEEIERP